MARLRERGRWAPARLPWLPLRAREPHLLVQARWWAQALRAAPTSQPEAAFRRLRARLRCLGCLGRMCSLKRRCSSLMMPGRGWPGWPVLGWPALGWPALGRPVPAYALLAVRHRRPAATQRLGRQRRPAVPTRFRVRPGVQLRAAIQCELPRLPAPPRPSERLRPCAQRLLPRGQRARPPVWPSRVGAPSRVPAWARCWRCSRPAGWQAPTR